MLSSLCTVQLIVLAVLIAAYLATSLARDCRIGASLAQSSLFSLPPYLSCLKPMVFPSFRDPVSCSVVFPTSCNLLLDGTRRSSGLPCLEFSGFRLCSLLGLGLRFSLGYGEIVPESDSFGIRMGALAPAYFCYFRLGTSQLQRFSGLQIVHSANWQPIGRSLSCSFAIVLTGPRIEFHQTLQYNRKEQLAPAA